MRKPVNGCIVEILARADGRLSFLVMDESGAESYAFVSQPITFASGGIVILGARGDVANGPSMWIDTFCLLPDAPGLPNVTFFPQQFPTGPDSILHPLASAQCKKWIDNRRAKFTTPKNLRLGRRKKTTKEQSDELRKSIGLMKDFCRQMAEGKSESLGNLATEIRALIFWKKDDVADNSYDPLLLRMASKADLPLPVFF
jgi:hypothetical protein